MITASRRGHFNAAIARHGQMAEQSRLQAGDAPVVGFPQVSQPPGCVGRNDLFANDGRVIH